ncbi:MAG: hypothetical protein ACT4OX_03495 [Actinomycetota bacterium]
MDTARLLTFRDAEVLLGRAVNRLEPSDEIESRRVADFVCFGGRAARGPMVGEFVSLAAGPSGYAPRHVPFFSVALESTHASAEHPSRCSISARWEQAGLKFALTYTCISVVDSDDVDDLTTSKRDLIAALARLVSDRVTGILRF